MAVPAPVKPESTLVGAVVSIGVKLAGARVDEAALLEMTVDKPIMIPSPVESDGALETPLETADASESIEDVG